jgi:hypothetical protein
MSVFRGWETITIDKRWMSLESVSPFRIHACKVGSICRAMQQALHVPTSRIQKTPQEHSFVISRVRQTMLMHTWSLIQETDSSRSAASAIYSPVPQQRNTRACPVRNTLGALALHSSTGSMEIMNDGSGRIAGHCIRGRIRTRFESRPACAHGGLTDCGHIMHKIEELGTYS